MDMQTHDLAATGSRRRRLWDLPTPAHELLLGLSLPAALLRSTVARAIGRQHAARCRVGGADTDVFSSCLHELGSRNVISEALQKLLETRHAPATRQLAHVRDETGLRLAWSAALANGDGPLVAPSLWAVLTHPLGEALQDEVLHAARGWMYASMRAGMALADQTSRLQCACEDLKAALSEARARCERAHAAAAARAESDAQTLARLRGELARSVQPASAGPATLPAHLPVPKREAGDTIGSARSEPSKRPNTPLPEAIVASHVPPTPLQIQGRNVLCVGGINGAVHRYRALVEARGGHFLHHDGGIEDKLARLASQLDAADLVLCQAACVNHEAYRCVKAHCKRTGTACVYLDRPSLARFARELGTVA